MTETRTTNDTQETDVSALFQDQLPLSGRVQWFEDNVHKMTSATLRRYLREHEDKQNVNPSPLSKEERLEVDVIVQILRNRLDEITPKLPADISSHDLSVGDRLLERWPDDRTDASRKIHSHFCELVFAWNMNPFKDDIGTASVDEFGETFGISRFAFTSKRDADNWLENYGLDDFVVTRGDDILNDDTFHYVTLSNQFTTAEVNEFLAIYNAVMTSLSILQDERKRAIINDGGRVGFACVDHFVSRESRELLRLRAARETLGAGYRELNKA